MLTYSFLLFIIFFGYLLSPAFANAPCQPIYGGGETCLVSPNMKIDKAVLNPKTNEMADNLSINDPNYFPEFITNFKITVTNTGSSTIDKIDVKDIFPKYIIFSTGPGKFDQESKTLSFSIENLEPNAIKTFVVVGRVSLANNLPKGTVCVVNQAIASVDTKDQASDNTQLCIENKIAEELITESPRTGPTAISLIILVSLGLLGYTLRRFSE